MIIGNGLIANVFSSYLDSNEILIFASGVSDSSECSSNAFQREMDLIKSYDNTKMKFVYFSSINIENKTEYFKHKKNIENYIVNNFTNYLIFRLPNLVGSGGNPNNMFNYFKRLIKSEDRIIVKNVFRSLLDVDDLKIICDELMFLKNKIINISHIKTYKVLDILIELSFFLKKPLNIHISDDEVFEKHYDNSDEVSKLIDRIYDGKEEYIKKIIKKYGKY